MQLDPQPWMTAPATTRLMSALGDARFVGGAVRNTLIGHAVSDIDVATPLTPEEVRGRLASAGIEAVPTGIEHGTITAVVDRKPFEVTTLRRDVETDGRRAIVAFTTDWKLDAQRRDFTMNALYASADGEVFDYVGGVEDLRAGRVRFVGDPVRRIREDYLRILRLFRFHAWYGKGEIDAPALAAAAQEKAGIAKLSGERVAKEMLRLLEAQNPVPVLRAMASSSVLASVIPGELNIDRLDALVAIDAANFFAPDPVLRLAALLPSPAKVYSIAEVADAVAARWRLSNAQRERLEDLATAAEPIVPYLSVRETRRLLYRLTAPRFRDRLFLKWAERPNEALQWRALLAMVDAWRCPRFPLSGTDAMRAGVPEGPLVGRVLGEVESWWVDSDFTDDKLSLAERLKAVVQAVVK
jgi:poly(A) polymerase